jgi:hypothetical protein
VALRFKRESLCLCLCLAIRPSRSYLYVDVILSSLGVRTKSVRKINKMSCSSIINIINDRMKFDCKLYSWICEPYAYILWLHKWLWTDNQQDVFKKLST